MEIDTNPIKEYDDVSLRPLHCKLNAHTRSDGSAMLTQGMVLLIIMKKKSSNELIFCFLFDSR